MGEPYADFLGCNCPGYIPGDGANAYLAIRNNAKNDYIYSYRTCKEFGDPMLANATACCHYCCGTIPINTHHSNHEKNTYVYDILTIQI